MCVRNVITNHTCTGTAMDSHVMVGVIRVMNIRYVSAYVYQPSNRLQRLINARRFEFLRQHRAECSVAFRKCKYGPSSTQDVSLEKHCT